ncbi:hypothetical protein [Paraglaciecola sp. 20A4]|nr:hypothetical protein [Paraglaciecola sp. 20A4]
MGLASASSDSQSRLNNAALDWLGELEADSKQLFRGIVFDNFTLLKKNRY